ncbi:MAG TPA: PEP-CTERM sorting domain-containing protein [Oscillatoriaceae cyanobacterium M33_DOE_052]|uniref:PEP-CTERM sorting domain-containing protein n=1 Tax=Planktothricoides sp. SpSt-374 TaxID=2282167 RepID=A0A7C3VV54_9CYAN|nr:PEP-CTERM sorting domain-containing protein [Oscillatoriaceae cyanobacterium M33_DOE_052]
MKIKLLSNLSLLAANVLVASSIVFQGQISTAESGSYRKDLWLGVYQIISYQYTKKSFTSDVYTIWTLTNRSEEPIPKTWTETKTIDVTGGLNWELAEISYQNSYSSTDSTTYTINPGKKGILKFYWTGNQITGGKVTTETYTPLLSSELHFWSEDNIGGGKFNYVPNWDYSEVDVPEPLTISGTGVALVFGVLLKRRSYLKSRT